MNTLTASDWLALAKAISTVLHERIGPLEKRLAELEQRPPVQGERGEKGDAGERGDKGEPGEPGQDGRSITVEDFRSLFEAEQAKALLDFERSTVAYVQRFLDRIPKPADGKDGLGFDDLQMAHDGERTMTLRFARGEQVREFHVKLQHPIYRGVYQPSVTYVTGDSVTFGGSVFIAKRETVAKPETNDDWQLAVKRGRDGKDGVPGAKGDPGPTGQNGRDLTQMGPRGEKW
jgi:hypothetical protein